MSKVNLNQIREIEKESDKIIVDAEKKVEEMIKSTNSAAEKIKNDAKANADQQAEELMKNIETETCLLYTSPSPRDRQKSRMPSSA